MCFSAFNCNLVQLFSLATAPMSAVKTSPRLKRTGCDPLRLKECADLKGGGGGGTIKTRTPFAKLVFKLFNVDNININYSKYLLGLP